MSGQLCRLVLRQVSCIDWSYVRSVHCLSVYRTSFFSQGFNIFLHNLNLFVLNFTEPKVSRIGSFAVRASQFFDTIGKKTGRKISSSSNLSNLRGRPSTVSSLESSCSPVMTPDTPVFLPEIPPIPQRKPVTHSGKLNLSYLPWASTTLE